MRTIVTAITAAALALSLTFQAAPANAAVPGYDSSYAGESAFLNLEQGDSGSFTVFFANTGTTTWTTGSATQVDLAACLEDKVTCNQQDADEATFNDGWLSATRYATHTQTSVAPGQIGTFTYNVTVPADAAEDTFRFNGALVLASTGADIHNEGYFQDVTTGTPPTTGEGAATLEELDPDDGSVEGGDTITITGTGFDCSPEPTVLFGDNEADVAACGEETLTVVSPAADVQTGASDVDVTVTNDGAAASNALTFSYDDDVAPTFDSVAALGQEVTMTFSEPVCEVEGAAIDTTTGGDDIDLLINGVESAFEIDIVECEDVADESEEASATVTLTATSAIQEGDAITVRLRSGGADEIEDTSGNDAEAGTETTTAEADVVAPTVESADITSSTSLTVTFSEPIACASVSGDDEANLVFNSDTSGQANVSPDSITCTGTGDSTLVLTFPASTFSQDETGDLEYDGSASDNMEDLSGNDVADFDVDVTALEADPPLIDDAQLTASGTGGFAGTVDSDDTWEIDFSEDMANPTATSTFRVSDGDGTIADIECSGNANANDNDVDALCTEDADDDTIWVIEIQETPENVATAGDGDLIALGDTPGLQYPLTIIDTSNVEDDEGNDVDLDNSDDVVIEDE